MPRLILQRPFHAAPEAIERSSGGNVERFQIGVAKRAVRRRLGHPDSFNVLPLRIVNGYAAGRNINIALVIHADTVWHPLYTRNHHAFMRSLTAAVDIVSAHVVLV